MTYAARFLIEGVGTAGAPAGLVLSIQGVVAGQAVPISGSVTISGTPSVNVAQWGGVATTLGQQLMAASVPVVIASNQGNINVAIIGQPIGVTSTQLPAALVGGRLDVNAGAWLGSTAPTVGQKTMANSVPVVLPSDQSTLNITDTKLPASAALADATANPTTTLIGSLLEAWNGAAWDRLVAAADNADDVAVATLGRLLVNARLFGFDGTNWDRLRSAGNSRQLLMALNRTTTIVEGKSAANTTQTITLAAPGAGLFHYITAIRIARAATAALAGTATLDYTTTNLNGIRWTVGNVMAAGGTQLDVQEQHATPIRSAVANTASTIVIPACGAAVLSQVWVAYYIDS